MTTDIEELEPFLALIVFIYRINTPASIGYIVATNSIKGVAGDVI